MVYLLWIVCFYDALILMLLPSSATFWLAADGAAARMVVDILALTIGMIGLYYTGFKSIPNKWLMLFVVFMIFSHFHSPNVSYTGSFLPDDMAIYNYKPMFEVLIFLLMFSTIASGIFTSAMLHKVYKTFAWVGLIYSGYLLLQKMGMDQIYHLIGEPIQMMSRNPQEGAFISQPVYAAILISMCLPFVIKYYPKFSPIILLGLLMTGNRTALIASAIILLVFCKDGRKYAFWAFGAYIAIIALMEAIYWVHPNLLTHFEVDPTSGRLIVWKQMLMDFLHPQFPGIHKTYILTGLGLGSFSIFYPFYNHSGWDQAHNEFIEILYSLSFVGLFLFIKIIQHVFQTVQDNYVFMSLLSILIASITMPVFHHPQLQFLTVFLCGLAYNKGDSYELGSTSK